MKVNGPEIRRKRELAGHSLCGFARLTGLSKAGLSDIETQKIRDSRPETLARIADALGVTIADLVPEDDDVSQAA